MAEYRDEKETLRRRVQELERQLAEVSDSELRDERANSNRVDELERALEEAREKNAEANEALERVEEIAEEAERDRRDADRERQELKRRLEIADARLAGRKPPLDRDTARSFLFLGSVLCSLGAVTLAASDMPHEAVGLLLVLALALGFGGFTVHRLIRASEADEGVKAKSRRASKKEAARARRVRVREETKAESARVEQRREQNRRKKRRRR